MKKIIYTISLIAIFTLGAFFIAAQDDTDNVAQTLRLVCIESIGCLHTPLNDEMLDAQFGSELQRFESGGDFEPIGEWATDYNVSSSDCSLLDEDQTSRYVVLISALDDSDGINIWGDFSRTDYERLGEGVYVGNATVGDGGTWIESIEFLVMTDENTMILIRMSNRLDSDGFSTSNSISCYRYLRG